MRICGWVVYPNFLVSCLSVPRSVPIDEWGAYVVVDVDTTSFE